VFKREIESQKRERKKIEGGDLYPIY